MVHIDTLLRQMFEKGASDLHLTAGAAPSIRLHGEMEPLDFEKLRPETCQQLVYSILTDEQKEKFERENELDLSFGVEGIGRVRMNVFKQRGAVASVLRQIPTKIKNFEDLMLPKCVQDIVKVPKGLVLVCGPTGSGKSTTLAAMIDWINENEAAHLITIGHPIEFVH